MLDCSDFLKEYSGFRDGSLDGVRMAAMRAHVAHCRPCARYDRVVEGGVDVLRALPAIEPSDDFMPRLQHRIYHIDDAAALRERRASGASAVILGGIAFAIGATAWAPLVRSSPPVVELPPIVAHAPHKVEALEHLFRAGPLLTGSEAGAAVTHPELPFLALSWRWQRVFPRRCFAPSPRFFNCRP